MKTRILVSFLISIFSLIVLHHPNTALAAQTPIPVLGRCTSVKNYEPDSVQGSIETAIHDWYQYVNEYMSTTSKTPISDQKLDQLWNNLSDYSKDYWAKYENRSKDESLKNFRAAREDTRRLGFSISDCTINDVVLLNDVTAIVTATSQGTKADKPFESQEFFVLHKENNVWRINMGNANNATIIDYLPLKDVPSQEIKNVRVEPVVLVRFMSTSDGKIALRFFFNVINNRQQAIIWAWAGATNAGFFVIKDSVISIKAGNDQRFETGIPYKNTWMQVGGLNDYPSEIKLQTFLQCSTLHCPDVRYINQPWDYSFSIPKFIPNQETGSKPEATDQSTTTTDDTSTVTINPNNQRINVRACASTTCKVLISVKPGETLPLLGQSSDGQWYAIQLDTGIGWIQANTVTPSIDPSSIPIIQS